MDLLGKTSVVKRRNVIRISGIRRGYLLTCHTWRTGSQSSEERSGLLCHMSLSHCHALSAYHIITMLPCCRKSHMHDSVLSVTIFPVYTLWLTTVTVKHPRATASCCIVCLCFQQQLRHISSVLLVLVTEARCMLMEQEGAMNTTLCILAV